MLQFLSSRVKFIRKTLWYPTYISSEHEMRLPNLFRQWGNQSRILNVGGAHSQMPTHVINLDVQLVPSVQCAADGHRLPFADNSFDVILAIALLEHVRKPWVIVEEFKRVLRPQGEVYIEVPFLQPYHADPGDYFRYTIPGLQSLFEDFQEIKSGLLNGPGSMLSWVLTEFAGLLFDRRGNFATSHLHWASSGFMRGKNWSSKLLVHVKYLDILLNYKEHAFVLASGVYFHGRKRLKE